MFRGPQVCAAAGQVRQPQGGAERDYTNEVLGVRASAFAFKQTGGNEDEAFASAVPLYTLMVLDEHGHRVPVAWSLGNDRKIESVKV